MPDQANEMRQSLLDRVATGRLAAREFLSAVGGGGTGNFGSADSTDVDRAISAGETQRANRASLRPSYDYIIVGAGAAGCVLAGELSASDARVLVIESGGNDDAPMISNPSV